MKTGSVQMPNSIMKEISEHGGEIKRGRITKRPNCAVPKCENFGFVYLGGKWICGQCAAGWTKAVQDSIFDEVKFANRKDNIVS